MKMMILTCITIIGTIVLSSLVRAQETAPGQSNRAAKVETEAEFQKRLAQDNGERPPVNVILSEVCYWPKAQQTEWVELTNVSQEAVDIKGWRLRDGQSLDFVIAEQPLSIPPDGFVVVMLDGSGQPAPPFDPQKKVVAHSPKGMVGNVLGDKGGHLALYSPAPGPERTIPSPLRSYVAWGFSPIRILSDMLAESPYGPLAIPLNSVEGTDFSVRYLAPVRIIQQGGSIGLISPVVTPMRFFNIKWGVFAPNEVNPGELNFKRGITLGGYPPDGMKTDSGIETLTAVFVEGAKYEFQVCADKACTQVFLDHIDAATNYITEKPIPPHSTYYWRARLIYPDGSVSGWSEIRSFIRP